VLRKGIVFIDLAIAQIAASASSSPGCSSSRRRLAGAARGRDRGLPGRPAAHLDREEVARKCRRRRSACCSFRATAGILLLAKNPHGGEHLRDLPAGQILG
jgi:zinc/manganese transport system permease protein